VRNIAIKRLIKAKTDSSKNINELIDSYLESAKSITKESIETLFSDVLIFVEKHYGNIDKNAVLKVFEDKIAELEILPKDSARLLYEKAINDGTDIVFGVKDIEAIKALESHLVWVANDSRERTQQSLKKIISEAYDGEYTKDEFFDKLRSEFKAYAKVEPHKLKAAANWHIRQNQNIAVVNRAARSATKYFRIRAKMDARTTAICRSMHGRLIPVEHIVKQVEGIMSAKSVGEAIKWTDTSKEKSGLWSSKLPSNVGIPPYHHGCRTIIEEVANSSLGDLKIDEFGRGVEVNKKVFDKIEGKLGHLKNTKYKDREKMVEDTLKNIAFEGYHGRDTGAKNILGKNGVFMVVDKNNNVITAFPPKDPKAYFDKQTTVTYYDSLNEKMEGLKKWTNILFG